MQRVSLLDCQLGALMGAPPQMRELPLLGRLDGPSIAHPEMVARCTTYRDAVRMSWALRRIKALSQRHAAELSGIHAPHIGDFLSADQLKRELPARHIPAWEATVGNTCVTQWLAAQARLTVLEEMQARKVA